MRRAFLSVALLGALAFALFDTGVRAEPLDAATCGLLKGEQGRMEQTGVRSSMDKGPAWAKSNLAADKLDQIRRLMELDEQLLFRCSTRNLVELPPDADADPAAAKADDEGKAPAAPKTDAPAAPVAKSKSGTAKNAAAPAAKAQPKEAAKTAPEAAKAAPAKKKPESAKAAAGSTPASDKAAAAKPKPKAKVDDAYKPPPPDPSVDPFASQPRQQ
jgi:hypothetical protein